MSARIKDASEAMGEVVSLLSARHTRPVYFQITRQPGGRFDVKQIEFVNVDELAEMCRVTRRTVYGWVEKKIIKAHQPPGTQGLLFDLHEAVQWVKGLNEGETG
jgi:excisionase family DNA binding protein